MSNDPQSSVEPSQLVRGTYLLPPRACRHREASRELILRAAESVTPNRAVVLGAGACDEIPLAELARRFAHVMLNDVDEQSLARGVDAASLDAASRGKIDVRIADLSGITQTVLDRIERVLKTCADPQTAIEAMSQILECQQTGVFPIEGKFDLVVASCVLSQLHFALTHGAGDRFESRFPGQQERLRQSSRWTAALYHLARRMEDKFVDDLAALVAEGGIIYLSESVQMCYIELASSGQWQTAGTYRMLRSTELSDYLAGLFTIVERARWEWVVTPPAAVGQTGRLYDVQALLLALRKP